MHNSSTTESSGPTETPLAEKPGASPLWPASGRTRRRRRHHVQRDGHLLVAVFGLGLLVFLLVLFGVIKFTSLNSANDLLRAKLQEREDLLLETQAALTKARRAQEAAVEGRFPHLRRLEFDKVLPVHKGYLKNIVFTLLKKSKNSRYEYKLVMENTGNVTVLPDVTLLVFDRLGVQLGGDEMPKQGPLARGETRSYSANIELGVPGEPYYFYLASG